MQHDRYRSPLSDQLDREWRRLSRRRQRLAAIERWASGDRHLDGLARRQLGEIESLDQLLDRCHHRHGRPADDLLLWLLRVGRCEPLAWRIVVQRCIPLVVAGAHRQRGALLTTAPVDEAISSLTMTVSSTDLPLGTDHVAPRLVSRAFHDAFRKPLRRHHMTELPSSALVLGEQAAVEPEANPIVVTARLLDFARSVGVEHDAVELARRLARGDSTEAIASDRDCTARTIRNRRARAVVDLQRVAARYDIDRHDHDSLIGGGSRWAISA